MDPSELVGDQIDDGRRFIGRFAAGGNPVRAAFWGKTAEEGSWFLYVVTDTVDRDGPAATYRAVHDAMRQLGDSLTERLDVKVVGPTNPVARDVLELMDRLPGRRRVGERILGRINFEYVYIYDPRQYSLTQAPPMTTDDVGREILTLMNRAPGGLQASRVTLRDGTSFNGAPFSLELGDQRTVVAKFIEDGEATPRVIRLDEIASIV